MMSNATLISSLTMSYSVLFLWRNGALLSDRTSSQSQFRSRTASRQYGFQRSRRSVGDAIQGQQPASISISSRSMPVFRSLEYSGGQDGLHRQTSGRSRRPTSQSSSHSRPIVERLCLPSPNMRARKTKPTPTWPLPVIRKFLKSSSHVNPTGCAEKSSPALMVFSSRPGNLLLNRNHP